MNSCLNTTSFSEVKSKDAQYWIFDDIQYAISELINADTCFFNRTKRFQFSKIDPFFQYVLSICVIEVKYKNYLILINHTF